MSSNVPSWLAQTTPSTGLPDWLTVHPARDPASLLTPRGNSPEGKALLFAQFEMVFPRVLEMVCAGFTANQALKDLPIAIDPGAFMRWLKKHPRYYEMYKEAKEIRTEAWTGEMVKHAIGEDTEAELDRSKFIVDTYKWLIARENRKEYGETKTIEMNQTISITAALAQAQSRVIEATLIDDPDVIDATEFRQLGSGDEDDSDDTD